MELAKQFNVVKKSIPKRSSQRKVKWQGEMISWEMSDIMLGTYFKEKFSDILETSKYFLSISLWDYDEKYENDKFIGDYDKYGYPRTGKTSISILWVKFNKVAVLYSEKLTDETYTIDKNEKYYKNFIEPYKSSKKRFHFFNITCSLPINKNFKWKERQFHSISAVYDSSSKIIDFVDTNRQTYTFTVKFKRYFKSIFDDIYGKGNYTTKYSQEYFQFGRIYQNCIYDDQYNKLLEDFIVNGPCAIFTLWFLELRLSNPGLTRKQVIHFLYEKTQKEINWWGDKEVYLCDIILRYGLFVHNYTKDYTVDSVNDKLVIKRKGKVIKSGKYFVAFAGFLSSIAFYNYYLKNLK